MTGSLGLGVSATAAEALPPAAPELHAPSPQPASLATLCQDALLHLPGKPVSEAVNQLCHQAHQLNGCVSVQGRSIFHLDRPSARPGGRRILVFSLTHGDETESGALARLWLERLAQVDARNSWRVVPVLNPDGLLAHTRVNANSVDINRNFPTRDWEKNALQFWKKTAAGHPRRFPGKTPGSEPETRCAVAQIEDFKPDLIVSIHTPYGVLDFDGPSTSLPRVGRMPARRLGTFPGSLGRFMWNDRNVPVLTVELHEGARPIAMSDAERLQDQLGDLALRIAKATGGSSKAAGKRPGAMAQTEGGPATP